MSPFPVKIPAFLRRPFSGAPEPDTPLHPWWRVEIRIEWLNHRSYMHYSDWSRDDLQDGIVHAEKVVAPTAAVAAPAAVETLLERLDISFPDDFRFIALTPARLSWHETLALHKAAREKAKGTGGFTRLRRALARAKTRLLGK